MNGLSFDLSRFQNPPKQALATATLKPRNAGRTLSAANEERIVQARDLLEEVLDQLDGSGTGNTAVPDEPPPQASNPAEPPKPAETRQAPVDLYEKLNLNNRRKANV